MRYTIIEKTQGRAVSPRVNIAISKTTIVFCVGFEKKYKADIKEAVRFAFDENGQLCFSFCHSGESNAYHITRTKTGALLVHTPRPILFANVEFGEYQPVKREDGWFATECRRLPEDEI